MIHLKKAIGLLAQFKNIRSLESLRDIINTPVDPETGIYVRWSVFGKEPPSGLSRDYSNSQLHRGLSAVQINPSWETGELLHRLSEYKTTRFRHATTANIYIGKQVGVDSDGYPSIQIIKYLGSVDDTLLDQANLIEAQSMLEEYKKRLVTLTDPFGIEIVKKTLIELQIIVMKLKNLTPLTQKEYAVLWNY